jgi:myo-inositol-1(or 4)-monophosphatase
MKRGWHATRNGAALFQRNWIDNMHPTLGIAVKAARRAGAIINRAARDIEGVTVSKKRHNDFVTEVDKAAEQAIIDILSKAYPDHAILAEESGAQGAPRADYTWIIDPLDGTTNFIHGFPQYAVSIALRHKDIIEQAVVFDPTRNELFTATRGRGAFLDDHRLRVTKRTHLSDALIATGFPFREFQHLDAYIAMFRDLISKVAGIRRPGAAALDLAWVAAGRLDGFWEIGLAPWDMAAGALLIQEAGGLVGDLNGDGKYLDSGNIVGGNPKIFVQLLQALAPYAPA